MFKSKLLISLFLATSLFAQYDDGEVQRDTFSLDTNLWKVDLSANINNSTNNVDYINDLGFTKSKDVSSFDFAYRSNSSWIPSLNINYFLFKRSANNTLTSDKFIGANSDKFSGLISSDFEYQEINTILYGTIENGIFEFDLGVNFKNIDFTQTISEKNSNADTVMIEGPDNVLLLPYVAAIMYLDGIDTTIKAESSVASIGDDEARDYKLSISYKLTNNLALAYGHKYNSWKSTDDNTKEKYDFALSGNYFSIKLLY